MSTSLTSDVFPAGAPSLAPPLAAAHREALVVAAWLIGVGVVTRAAFFGDLAYYGDEAFYWVAGLRMHDGLVPHVDVWDRKGLGLFLTYWAITGLSRAVLCVQLVALAFAVATAFTLRTIARRWVGPVGAALAGTLYLAALPMFGGGAGQTPVFYNLFVALAAWLVLAADPQPGRALPPARWIAAMACAGFAITYKQSALPEAVFLGLFALGRLRAAGAGLVVVWRQGALLALAGAAPFALFCLAYAGLGHLDALWDAMVNANLRKATNLSGNFAQRVAALVKSASPALVLATAGLAMPGCSGAGRRFAALWLAAATVGFLLLPNAFHHYVLPMLAPVSLGAAFAMDRRPWGMASGLAAAWLLAFTGGSRDGPQRAETRATIQGLAALIRERDPHPRVLVYQGPQALNGLLASYPPSPLLDNLHLNFRQEDNTGPFDTAAEMARDLAWRPSVIVAYPQASIGQENPRTGPMLRAYLRRCRVWRTVTYREANLPATIEVAGDCAR